MQLVTLPFVAGYVLLELGCPEFTIGLGGIRESAPGMAVPVAAVYQYDCASAGHYDVWTSG